LWFLDQLQPGSAAYNLPVAVRLAGALDIDALRRALAEVVRRHEALRTTFAARDGEPVQVIAAAAPLELAPRTRARPGCARSPTRRRAGRSTSRAGRSSAHGSRASPRRTTCSS
jgi:hypothetical protein